MGIFKDLAEKLRFGKRINLDNIDEGSFITIANEYITALGGKENIENIYSCSTRLRVFLKENKIDTEKLKSFGAKRIINLDEKNYQIVVGKNATKLEEVIKKYLA